MTPNPAQQRDVYWRRNLTLTGRLLLVWFVATFVMIYFARELGEVSVFGWPISFYMAAQGSPIIFLIITWYYARALGKLDDRHGAADADSEG